MGLRLSLVERREWGSDGWRGLSLLLPGRNYFLPLERRSWFDPANHIQNKITFIDIVRLTKEIEDRLTSVLEH